MENIVDGFVIVNHEDTHSSADDAPPASLKDISSVVDSLADDLWPVNKKIHDNPELGFKEFIAHETLTAFMKSRPGWKVTPSAYGMPTAWVAVFDTGKKGPVVSFNVEMGKGTNHDWNHDAPGANACDKMRYRELGMPADIIL